MGEGKLMIIVLREKGSQGAINYGRAYPHRIPLARLKCVSEKRVRELAGRLLQSREASDRDYNPQPCPLPTSPWCGK